MTQENKTPQPNAFAMPEFRNASDMMMHEIQALMPLIKDENFKAPQIKYSEERFRKYFAPFFLGVLEVPAGENIQALWVSEIGTLHTEVDIIDNQGNILFVVPPLMNLETIDLHNTGVSRVRFASINQIFEEDSRNFPEKARLEYYQGIGQKLSTVFKGIRNDPSHTEKWLKIFSFYNVTPPSSEQFKIVPNENYRDPNNLHTPVTSTTPNWTNLGQLDFNPTFD